MKKCEHTHAELLEEVRKSQNLDIGVVEPTYTLAQVQEMKNAWVDEVAGRVEDIEKYRHSVAAEEKSGDEMRAEVLRLFRRTPIGDEK